MNIEKIAVNGHYVWVDKDAKIKEGDNYVRVDNRALFTTLKNSNPVIVKVYCHKIVAADAELELNSVPTYVDFLSNEHNKTYFDYDETNNQSNYDFIAGYKAAEKELFTEDDIRMALSEAFKANQDGYDITTEEIIEQLKLSKNK